VHSLALRRNVGVQNALHFGVADSCHEESGFQRHGVAYAFVVCFYLLLIHVDLLPCGVALLCLSWFHSNLVL
jgi:hypothetical protein